MGRHFRGSRTDRRSARRLHKKRADAFPTRPSQPDIPWSKPTTLDAVRAMESDFGMYEEAFLKVLSRMRAGEITTPQQGNEAMAAHKEPIRRLEENAFGFASRHSKAMAIIDKQVTESMAHTAWLMV